MISKRLDDNIENINKKQSYNSYWGEVAALTEGDDNWSVYEVLPRLARGLGTHFNSGSEMERAFSRQSDIHRDPKRNGMTHETLDSHMQIRYGIECLDAKRKCSTCMLKVQLSEKDDNEETEVEKTEEKKICVCHCKYSEITDEMMVNCGEAWRLSKESEGNDDIYIDNDDGEPLVSEQRLVRLAKLRCALPKRSTFYQADSMQPLYETTAEKKKATMAKKLAELKNIKDKNTPVNAGSGKKKDKSKTTDNAVTSATPSTTSTATSGSKNGVKTTSSSTISKPLDKYRIPKKSDSSAKLAKETDDAIVVKKVTKAATNSSKVNRSTVLNKGKRCGEEITGATVTKKDCKVPTSKVTPTSTDLGKRKETKIQQLSEVLM